MATPIATQEVFAHTEALCEVWTAISTVGSGAALMSANSQPAVGMTGTGDYTTSEVVGPYTLSGIPAGGVGLVGKEISVAVDGTWEFPVTGGLTSTAQNTIVYAVVATGEITSLTLTATGNVAFGKVNYPKDYVKVAGVLPVKVGA